MLFLGKCFVLFCFFSSSDLVSWWRWEFSWGLRSMNFKVLGEGWCSDVVSGQAAPFALEHVILGCRAECVCWAPGGLRAPPLLGLLQKAQLEETCGQSLPETRKWAKPESTRVREKGERRDCSPGFWRRTVGFVTLSSERGRVTWRSRAWMLRLNNSWVVCCCLLVVQSL